MENKTNSRGLGFLGVLTLIFITLKLIGYIDWSWWWVLSPLLIPLIIGILILAPLLIYLRKKIK
ncbi:hypothetical protein SAMN05421544_12132 [Riemerella columbipharyngis]|uniref:Transmembrane Fragile-X-F protein n=1 Tax=Riemerella columbipharyngis TaxID=1071918 RepID=A0A1G7FC70_9FLAO|nr:hypothetical protein SAMN05421544_12132 [Riemerella columbipharyngis]